MKKYIPKIVAVILAVFALFTFYLSFSVIFDLFGVRAKQGNYVLFVVWGNLICSITYFVAVYGLFTLKKWASKILLIPLAVLALSFIALNIYANNGGLHEAKTFSALIVRFVITSIAFLTAYFFISKNKN